MRKIIFLIPLFLIITSCDNEPVDYPDEDHTFALDTLQNYSDYILGDFNNKFLVSTDIFAKGYGASIVSNPIDSSHIQFQIGYRSLEDDIEKSTFVTFRLLESKTKLDPDKHYRYKNFTDFVDFFDRNRFQFFQRNKPIGYVHNVWIQHQNLYEIDNDINGYNSLFFDRKITSENFKFLVDSIKVIEDPKEGVEVYYSFKCVGVNFYGDQIVIENGKGKSTFEFH